MSDELARADATTPFTDDDQVLPNGVFKFLAAVYVTIEDGLVTEVHVDDESDIATNGKPELIEGESLDDLIEACSDHTWPAWEFGW